MTWPKEVRTLLCSELVNTSLHINHHAHASVNRQWYTRGALPSPALSVQQDYPLESLEHPDSCQEA